MWIFGVCGLPEAQVYSHKLLQENYQVALEINVEKLMQPVPTNELRSPK